MADQNITELPIKTNTGVANTDYMLGIDASEGYQILVRDVAKYIVENYNGSTLAGSAQTPKSALDALNSKFDGIGFYNKQAGTTGNTFTFGNSNRGLMITIDSSQNRCGFYFLWTSGNGGVNYLAIKDATELTFDKTVANKLTITSPGSTKVIFIMFYGTVS